MRDEEENKVGEVVYLHDSLPAVERRLRALVDDIEAHVSRTIPSISLPDRFFNDHLFIVQLFVKRVLELSISGKLRFRREEKINAYTAHVLINFGIGVIDGTYLEKNGLSYSPALLVAEILLFLETHGHKGFIFSADVRQKAQ